MMSWMTGFPSLELYHIPLSSIGYIFFICSSMGGHLSWFHILTIVNGAIINMGVQISLQHTMCTVFGYMPNSGIFGSYNSSMLLLLEVFIYFKGRVTVWGQIGRQRKKEGERSSMHWLTPQMAAVSKTRPVWSREPRTPSRSTTWMAEPKYLSHQLLPPMLHINRKLDGKWVSWDLILGNLVWNAGILYLKILRCDRLSLLA